MTVVPRPSRPDAAWDAAARRADALLARMDLREKIGQMTQVEKNSVPPGAVRDLGLGSVLSGGGGNPEPNTPAAWREMVLAFQREALESRLGIPLLYGVDAVHGHNNVVGATIFPHNIGLGAAGDPELVRRIGRATSLEVAATGVRWTFAPAVSIPQDIRWGRTYEGYGQDPELVCTMATALVEGLRGEDWSAPDALLPSVKHFIADGATRWGSSSRVDQAARAGEDRTLANAQLDEAFERLLAQGAWQLDQGVSEIDEATLRAVHLPPYRAALEAGALNVMASYSAWGGLKMHAHRYLLTDVLKGELGFRGFVVTDWEALDQLHRDYYAAVVEGINAGIDMVMVPFDYERFLATLERAVGQGDVAEARVDDAVRRILAVKARLGLFERPVADDVPLDRLGAPEHRALARRAAARSAVLLAHRPGTLPLAPEGPVLVAGRAADDVGLQCGGWTISWMGGAGAVTPGSTLLDGLREGAPGLELRHEPDADGEARAPLGIVALAEDPYAEGMGDRADLGLTPDELALLRRVRARVDRLVLVLYAGRPRPLGEGLELADAVVAAWLPGSEGAGVADVLLGLEPFSGRLSFAWPRDMAQVAGGGGAPLFPIGHGLTPTS